MEEVVLRARDGTQHVLRAGAGAGGGLWLRQGRVRRVDYEPGMACLRVWIRGNDDAVRVPLAASGREAAGLLACVRALCEGGAVAHTLGAMPPPPVYSARREPDAPPAYHAKAFSPPYPPAAPPPIMSTNAASWAAWLGRLPAGSPWRVSAGHAGVVVGSPPVATRLTYGDDDLPPPSPVLAQVPSGLMTPRYHLPAPRPPLDPLPPHPLLAAKSLSPPRPRPDPVQEALRVLGAGRAEPPQDAAPGTRRRCRWDPG